MSLYVHLRNAKAEYHSNVYRFIGLGEGLELTALEVHRIKVKYPRVEEWYDSLPEERRRTIDKYLDKEYGNEINRQTEVLRKIY